MRKIEAAVGHCDSVIVMNLQTSVTQHIHGRQAKTPYKYCQVYKQGSRGNKGGMVSAPAHRRAV